MCRPLNVRAVLTMGALALSVVSLVRAADCGGVSTGNRASSDATTLAAVDGFRTEGIAARTATGSSREGASSAAEQALVRTDPRGPERSFGSWVKTTVGTVSAGTKAIVVGDVRNEGRNRLYVLDGASTVYEFNWNGSSWDRTTVTTLTGCDKITIGRGRNDNTQRIYANGGTFREVSWNGDWQVLDLGPYDVGNEVFVANGRNDGHQRVYAYVLHGTTDLGVTEFTWTGGGFDTSVARIYSLGLHAIGPGRNDATNRMYLDDVHNRLHEFTWTGASWDSSPSLSIGGGQIATIRIGYGRNDGVNRLYVGNQYGFRELTWTGASWNTILMDADPTWVTGVAMGRGRGDDTVRVYGNTSTSPYRIREYTWRAGNWESDTVGTLVFFGDLILADGRSDGHLRIYAANDSNVSEFTYSPSGIEEGHSRASPSLGFCGCTPNPFRHQTSIRYSLARETKVRLDVFDATGRAVATLVDGRQGPGDCCAVFNTDDVRGAEPRAGVYFCRLQAGEFTTTGKISKTE